MKTLIQELKRHRLLLISLAISIGLLVIFLILQYRSKENETVLNLDPKWIIVSGVPILIGLFIGGYIKNLKGFGLELEYNLKELIPLTIVSKITLHESIGFKKEDLNRLYTLTQDEKEEINRLRFEYGKKGYYTSEAIDEHFRELKNLKFIEVINKSEEFLFVLPAMKLKVNPTPDRLTNADKVTLLIKTIEKENFTIEKEKIDSLFFDAVTDHILTTDSIIEAYRKIKSSRQSRNLFPKIDVLPVLDEKKKMIGTVAKQKLESTIADEVEKQIT